MTKNHEVRFAKSIVDYIFRWMATKFLSAEAQWDAGVNIADPTTRRMHCRSPAAAAPRRRPPRRPSGRSRVRGHPEPGGRAAVLDLRLDHDRSGSCYKCANCGTTSGCA